MPLKSKHQREWEAKIETKRKCESESERESKLFLKNCNFSVQICCIPKQMIKVGVLKTLLYNITRKYWKGQVYIIKYTIKADIIKQVPTLLEQFVTISD